MLFPCQLGKTVVYMKSCDCMSLGDRLLKSIMGNAVRIQNELSKVVKSDVPNSCTACGVHFNVIQHRRRQCSKCKDFFCSSCLIRVPASTQSNGSLFQIEQDSRVCNRCRVFSSANYSWDELMQLKVRDLVWFLERQQVCTRGLKEKEQLVELIMNCFGSDRYLEAQARRQQRVAVMTSNMQTEFPTAGSSQSRSGDQSEEANPQEPAPAEPPQPSTPPRDPSPQLPREPSPQLPRAPSSRLPREPSSQPSTPLRQPPSRPSDPHPSSSDLSNPTQTVSSPSTPQTRNDRVLLANLHSCDDVDSLSVRQLKHLLTANHVNYRGCCEKTELISKAKQLVRSHLDNVRRLAAAEESNEASGSGTSAGGVDDPLEDDMCKICMDALIDCVLLECGHMVTCLDCGKRMAECPICRQYVVRAVRIFKA